MSNREPRTLHRRQVLAALGASVGAAAAAACSASSTSPTAATPTASSTTTTTPTTSASTCAVSPTETRGPYPDTVGMINNSSFFRRDITPDRH
jgi:hypothetical protein